MRNVVQSNPLDWLTDVLGRLRDKIEWLHENILSDALKKSADVQRTILLRTSADAY